MPLMLTRRVGESVLIGDGADQVEVYVAEVEYRGEKVSAKVRLGFKARDGIKIFRKELIVQEVQEEVKAP